MLPDWVLNPGPDLRVRYPTDCATRPGSEEGLGTKVTKTRKPFRKSCAIQRKLCVSNKVTFSHFQDYNFQANKASSSSNEYSMFTFLRSSSSKPENQHTDFVSYLRFLMKLIVRRVNAQILSSNISLLQTKKLDYQVSICSLIPPATATSKTQDRADTSVWWKLPFSIFFIIYYVQSAIIYKVSKPELWFLCSAHPIIVLYICMKFHENISNNF